MSNPNANGGSNAVGLSDHIAAMKKSSFTQDWDYAATYDYKSVNEVLAERFREGNHGLVTDVKVSVNANDRHGGYTQWYQFTLGSPSIQFESSSNIPTCSLKAVITKGKIWTVSAEGKIGSEVELRADAYSISISNISLGAITGSAQELNDTNTPKASGGNDLVVLPAEDGYSSHIVIDLAASPQLGVSIDYASDVEVPYTLKQDHLRTLHHYFVREIKAIRYTLAIVNNVKPSDSSADLVPKAFRFTTLRASDTESYLTIFIQTQSSDKRNNNQFLQSLWIAKWTEARVPPIPKDSSTSIIINDSFFASQFISPALARHDATGTIEKMSDEQGGIRVKGTWPNLTRPEAFREAQRRTGLFEEMVQLRIHSVEYDPNVGGSPLQITLAQSNGTDKPATMSVEWSYSFDNSWSLTRIVTGPPVAEERGRKWDGTFKSTYSVSLKKDLINLDERSFNVEIKKSDWTVDVSDMTSTSVIPTPGEVIDEKGFLELAQEASVDMITLTFDFANLKFFAYPNVSLPGRVARVNNQSELRVPRDVVLVGVIAA